MQDPKAGEPIDDPKAGEPIADPKAGEPIDDETHHMTHAAAQDPIKYRREKAKAEQLGKSLIIDAPIDGPRAPAPGTVMIPRNATPQQYRAMKADAERRGVSFAIQEEGR